jgi:hypothetical protein
MRITSLPALAAAAAGDADYDAVRRLIPGLQDLDPPLLAKISLAAR